MISIKQKQMRDDEIVDHLKIILDTCDAEDLKSKKFVGLLNDHIPYNQGLKVRLELIAKGGYIDELKKMNRLSDHTDKLNKMASSFSRTYGFVLEESVATFNLLAKALSVKALSQNTASLKIVHAVQSGNGNFSKKHLHEEKVVKIEPPVIKKRFIRNKVNLLLYILFVVANPTGFYLLIDYFKVTAVVIEHLQGIMTFPLHLNSWFIGSLIATGMVVMLPFAANWTFKFNLMGFYPLIMLLAQVVLFLLQPAMPQIYSAIQASLGVVMLISFMILAFYAIRLPKGANEYTAQRAILPYYLSAVIWFMGQYVFYGKLI